MYFPLLNHSCNMILLPFLIFIDDVTEQVDWVCFSLLVIYLARDIFQHLCILVPMSGHFTVHGLYMSMAPMSGHFTAYELSQLGMTQQMFVCGQGHTAANFPGLALHDTRALSPCFQSNFALSLHDFSSSFSHSPMPFLGVLSFMHRVHIIFIAIIL